MDFQIHAHLSGTGAMSKVGFRGDLPERVSRVARCHRSSLRLCPTYLGLYWLPESYPRPLSIASCLAKRESWAPTKRVLGSHEHVDTLELRGRGVHELEALEVVQTHALLLHLRKLDSKGGKRNLEVCKEVRNLPWLKRNKSIRLQTNCKSIRLQTNCSHTIIFGLGQPVSLADSQCIPLIRPPCGVRPKRTACSKAQREAAEPCNMWNHIENKFHCTLCCDQRVNVPC